MAYELAHRRRTESGAAVEQLRQRILAEHVMIYVRPIA
jgi:hypothetical protein